MEDLGGSGGLEWKTKDLERQVHGGLRWQWWSRVGDLGGSGGVEWKTKDLSGSSYFRSALE